CITTLLPSERPMGQRRRRRLLVKPEPSHNCAWGKGSSRGAKLAAYYHHAGHAAATLLDPERQAHPVRGHPPERAPTPFGVCAASGPWAECANRAACPGGSEHPHVSPTGGI